MTQAYEANWPTKRSSMSAFAVSQNPDPLQQRMRRKGFHLLGTRHFGAYKSEGPGRFLVFDFSGNKVAGPFDLDSATAWFEAGARTRTAGGAS